MSNTLSSINFLYRSCIKKFLVNAYSGGPSNCYPPWWQDRGIYYCKQQLSLDKSQAAAGRILNAFKLMAGGDFSHQCPPNICRRVELGGRLVQKTSASSNKILVHLELSNTVIKVKIKEPYFEKNCLWKISLGI